MVTGCDVIGNNTHGIIVNNQSGGVQIVGNNISLNSHIDFTAVGVKLGLTAPIENCLVKDNLISKNDLGIEALAVPSNLQGNLIINNQFADNGTLHNIETGNSYAQFIDVKKAAGFISTDPRANLVF